jgi:SAM-dependent methyltransferase
LSSDASTRLSTSSALAYICRMCSEIGAGTGKATRLFAQRGVTVTATEPDGAMLAEMRKHVPANVKTVQAAFEDLRPGETYGLAYAAVALHWTNPEGRCWRMAALLEPGGVFASFGGPVQLADPAVHEAVRAARAPVLESDQVPSPDGTASGHDMRWPGTELQRSEWLADVQQSVIGQRLTMSACDYVGHLSTISAYLELPTSEQEQVYSRITQILPETVEITADIIVHVARRRCCDLRRHTRPLCASIVVTYRSDWNAVRTSSENTCGCSQAAKWPPLSASWK